MLCAKCNSILRKHGFNQNRVQRFRCSVCLKVYLAPCPRPFGKMKLPTKKGLACLQSLLEGMSIRSTERITGIHRDTILDLLTTAGTKCEQLLNNRICKVPVIEVQADEVWCFVKMKERTKLSQSITDDHIGTAYTFIALESKSKLILAWHLGQRTYDDTEIFTNKIDYATSGHFQICTDGFKPYRTAIDSTLGTRVDFGQVVKTFKAGFKSQTSTDQRRYSPTKIFSIGRFNVIGVPQNISTSHIERFNLTLRMQVRRFTRLTNAFSKKWENLHSALALYFAYYNFCRKHSSIKCTPAMAAGLTDHAWSIEELLS